MSNKKKNAVKKTKEGSAKLVERQQVAAYVNRQEARFAGQCDTDQIMIMAVGRVLAKTHTTEWMERFFRQVDCECAKVTQEYAQLFREDYDGNSDKQHMDISMTKVSFDREMQKYLGGFMAGWDYRWCIDRHTLGLRVGNSTNIDPETEQKMKAAADWTLKAGIR